jgi:S-phase kinase-associated protein 1
MKREGMEENESKIEDSLESPELGHPLSVASKIKVRPDAGLGDTTEITRAVAALCKTIENMLVDLPPQEQEATTGGIPLRVAGPLLAKVIEYAEYIIVNPPPKPKTEEEVAEIIKKNPDGPQRIVELTEYDKEFCGKLEQKELFELILAANYLEFRKLLDACTKTVADMITGKTPEQIRQTFNIKNDFTPEEELKIWKDNGWCSQDFDPTKVVRDE